MLLQQIINGITIGSTYALVAIGFTMVFGVLELTNFANGSLYMLGAYLSLMLYLATGNFWVSFAGSIILTGAAGYLIERLALRHLRQKGAPKLSALITTLGMSMLLDNLVMICFGSESKPFPNKLDFGRFTIGSAVVSYTQVIILAVACILMLILSLVVYKTKLGKAMRCTAQNMEAARLMGINTNQIIAMTFVIAGALACISGTLVGMYYSSIDVSMGSMIGMKIFASAILGGVGVLPGAVVGGLCMGILETVVAGFVSSGYRDAIAFTVLIVVLLFRPSGLFGKKQINKV
ncbi:MAG: branched-chain amino acid ABC transporter permease [Hungatella sp.]|nr:branched-chain amino acid ABC transporter permease [Hungatella sp.]